MRAKTKVQHTERRIQQLPSPLDDNNLNAIRNKATTTITLHNTTRHCNTPFICLHWQKKHQQTKIPAPQCKIGIQLYLHQMFASIDTGRNIVDQ